MLEILSPSFLRRGGETKVVYTRLIAGEDDRMKLRIGGVNRGVLTDQRDVRSDGDKAGLDEGSVAHTDNAAERTEAVYGGLDG